MKNPSVENIDYKLYPTLLDQNVAHCHTRRDAVKYSDQILLAYKT